ncbi:lysylphosphatidylglycerol synthase domain-containing protein [Parapusillimonas granuli]|uniref:UPF0104 family protein n=1 Tax=Parapusillimonas granuli TaxID=380911 RepID=A0A853FZY5_9BURK|nr:lysylphosphatidylglycerol synthase domain-containing protein [Parapusillimonas granuli]MBB5214097.1 hypothetical protein [Parapusillimonas granuli]MEB2400946.1 lysylphosphatidylglycerol synthase domain-containing protein [Alcaligenaceae bacterium]NYT50518.1 UPF0104 family protein [Parapusillimonas granuli]
MSASGAGGLLHWARRHWSVIRKAAGALFLVLVLVLLSIAVTQVAWNDVAAAIRQLSGRTVMLAALIALASYLVYSCFDLLGKWYTGHELAWWRAMMVGFISYAFTMNMGAPVGGVGLRVRLYSKQGLPVGVVMRVMAMSLATNWLGYVLLAGLVFVSGQFTLPFGWSLGDHTLQFIGAAMVAAALAYLLLCAYSTKRSWQVHGHEIELPNIGLAAVQMGIAMVNWMLIAAVIYVLMQQRAPYGLVLGALLVSAIAGALLHIPGGIGVLESVFIAMVASASFSRPEVLGSILVYRAVYYLGPLLIAGAWYLGAEAKIKKPRDGRLAGQEEP